jgi:signal transduction histidine kinase
MTARAARRVVVALAVVQAALLVVVGVNTTRWIGTTFPGFFLVSNRVIPSIALNDWADGQASRFFQHQVVAVDGIPASSAAAVYERVRQQPPGTPIAYTLRSPRGTLLTAVVRSQRFSETDYAMLFVALLLTSAAFSGAGLLVAFLKPTSAASRGLLASCYAMGIFLSSAVDLWGPHWFVRLHVIAEVFVAPAFLQLVLVFPRERWPRHRGRILAGLYLAFAAFAVVYELALASPSAYTTVHLIATAAHAAAAASLVGVAAYDRFTTRSALVRRRIGIAALGTLGAFLIPAAMMASSALLGGAVPINASIFTAFLFPLSLAYAVIKQDLFEIDLMVRRVVSYVTVVLCIAVLYVCVLSAVGFLTPGWRAATQSPVVLAILNVGLLFLIAPLEARVRNTIDRVFFHKRWDTDQALADLSRTLVSAHTLERVFAETHAVLAETLCPVSAALFAVHANGGLDLIHGTSGHRRTAGLTAALAARLARGEILSRYEWDDGSGRPVPAIWRELDADLLVPIVSGDVPIATLVLGPKNSGRSYNANDLAFLHAAANQIALAMKNAEAFAELEAWTARLEEEVQERTADLQRSVREVRTAYQQLETNQASLMRADRLATLGRLTAGIAHEVNTPLGATLNALSIIRQLAAEYTESIDDPAVTRDDHRQIARELMEKSTAAAGWARKAAAFINRVRVQGREPEATTSVSFTLASVVAESQALLTHRLRTCSCELEFTEEEDFRLTGDPGRFGQVLVNLVGNAIDAYEEHRIFDGRIEILARRIGHAIVVTVRDWAGGIPADLLPRIFEEMVTTKEPGRGTGIGLSIARSLVEQAFGGTLAVEVDDGIGSCFTITLPAPMVSAAALG